MSRTSDHSQAYRKRKTSRSNSDQEDTEDTERRTSSEPRKVRRITSSTRVSTDRRSNSSSSEDDSLDKCPICLKCFKNQTLAITDSCRHHTFCLDCLQEWSKTRKTCPVDRREYSSILVLDIRGKVTRQLAINPVVPSTIVISWSPPYDATFCEICGLVNNEDGMLVCDGCGMGFHLYCLMPPMDSHPNGIWLCNDCWDYYN
ncbi:PHD and RING finger domain-containing protein 1-like [Anthonomus grandis grandis]|uniref:PHD and RING finger domain-containing protein 1-like n=1 Tax=Anthonomus grandis grandis TaxID=2921223 RepID=UPI0021654AC2|nr:PHD and RING finger domain-containing protein 1-like [Anthonomus grandis grandis]